MNSEIPLTLSKSKYLAVTLVSSQAIISDYFNAKNYLIEISYKLPIGVGHTINIPFYCISEGRSMVSSKSCIKSSFKRN